MREEDRDRVAADGLCGTDIDAVRDHLVLLRANELISTKPHVLRQLIESVSASPAAIYVNTAQGTYFRGMKLALAGIDRRYGTYTRVLDNGRSAIDPKPEKSNSAVMGMVRVFADLIASLLDTAEQVAEAEENVVATRDEPVATSHAPR